ncbi:MAG: hypothetical protein EON91_06775 [Brevundimonas sp.]|uniref:glycosyl hydrolase family 18 protein n=1 Tax=Brevundimonas sp. TaxID=1871086 RepID=UPI00122AEFCD|nr:glycosyl hydrolase family 18 protein [Brevundimonas sp.]RZJ18032.1 MAG: hypothetical protein EON91_06775 [Brevundimonas sp.]
MNLRYIGLALSALLLLSACGGGGGDGGGGDPPPPPPQNVQITITPDAIETPAEGTVAFTCAVTGSTNTACTWRVDEQGGGTISTGGFYTAPTAQGTYHVTATASADTSRTARATVTVRPRQTGATPWVTAYYLGYYMTDGTFGQPPHTIDMSAMTHLAIGRVAPGTGTIDDVPQVAGDVIEAAGNFHNPDASRYPGIAEEDYLIDRARAAGVKTLLMLGGMGDGEGFIRSSSDAVRPTFVRNIVDYMVEHDYDGLDLDWEDNLSDGGAGVDGEESLRRLVALIHDVRAEANSRARYRGANAPVLITFPGYGLSRNDYPDGTTGEPAVPVEQWRLDIAHAVDQYNLMSYGIGSVYDADGWQSWFTSPIFGETGSTPFSLDYSVRKYVAAGVPRSRLGIGIGFFGIYYNPGVTGPYQNISNLQLDDNALAWNRLLEDGYFNTGDVRWHELSKSTYRVYSGAGHRPPDGRAPAGLLSYEDQRSIAAKGQWVRETGLGGTIVWAINYGHVQQDHSNPPLQWTKQAFLQ